MIYKCPAFVGHERFASGSIDEGEQSAGAGETTGAAAPGGDPAGTQVSANRELWQRCRECPYVPLCGEGCQFGSYLRYGDTSKLNCRKEFIEYMVREHLKLNYRYRKNKRE